MDPKDEDFDAEPRDPAAGNAKGGNGASQEEAAGPLPDDEFAYYEPRSGKQAWLILGVIIFVVAVAVLLVYQTGDKKTILSKESLQPRAAPAAAPVVPAAWPGTVAAAPMPAVAPTLGARNCPTGGGCMGQGCFGPATRGGGGGGGMSCPGAAAPVAQLAAFGSPPSFAGNPPTAQPAVCPRCAAAALPLCDRCNAIMMPTGAGLYYCPNCGAVGTPLCPYCNARMTGDGSGVSAPVAAMGMAALAPSLPAAPQAVPGGFGGQFVCPTCNLTGLPNWSAGGTPRCPQCNGAMTPRGAAP